jgi:hypothetical protein
VTDPGGLSNHTAYTLKVETDDDWDNDRMSDAWERKYRLDTVKEDSSDDPDNDGYTNYDEFRMGTPPDRKGGPDNNDTENVTRRFTIPIWATIVAAIVLTLIVFVIVVLILIKRQDRALEEEDKKLDEYVKKQEERLAQSQKIYGTQVAGAQAQSNVVHTQTVDLTKLTEEEKMFIAIGDGKASVGDLGGKKLEEPQMVSAGSGPLFDNSAPKLEFSSETIKLETLSTPKDDHEIVIETVTLGMQEDPDLNKNLTKSAPKRQ